MAKSIETRAEDLLKDCENHQDRVDLVVGLLESIQDAVRGLKARLDHLEALEAEEGDETHYEEMDNIQSTIDALEERT